MIYVHLADGFEEIEALTVVDVLRRADMAVETVSVTGKQFVRGAHDITVAADILFEEADYHQCEMIVLPGGMPGTLNLGKHQGLCSQMVDFSEKGKWLAAICAAPSVLGRLSLLKGKRGTCYPGFEDQLIGADYSEDRVVVDGNVVTSKGPGTAIEFSLKLVELLKSKQIADGIRKGMIV